MREIRYTPRNVRETLVELKDISELAIDLAYSALLAGDEELATEVIELESRVDFLEYHARIALMLAAKRVDDAERLVGIFQVVDTAVATTHAAGDIARILTKNVGHPASLRAALPEAQEAVVRATVAAGSDYDGKTLTDLDIQSETGVRVIAVRRDDQWHINPDDDLELGEGDVLIGSGTDTGVEQLYAAATGSQLEAKPVDTDIDDLERAVRTVMELRTVSEVAVGLAYSAALFDDDELAEEVNELERRSDELQSELEGWVIDAVPRVENPHRLRGLLHLARASEAICDAAVDITDAVLRNVPLHPVFGQAVRESAEIIGSATVRAGSELVGQDVDDLELEANTGMVVLAIRRGSEWLFDPAPGTTIETDDVLVARGPRDGEAKLRAVCQAD